MIKKSKGFTLIEVLIAVIILGVAFPTLIEGLISIVNSFQKNREYTKFYIFEENKLNEFEAGIEISDHGEKVIDDIEYRWWILQEIKENNQKKIVINIQKQGDNKKYSLEREINYEK
ncbi:type IV pilus modification PilV family protein [Haliovirga abyssi]|uniref:Prepilin-type N-terminal cleavage/methylation domain-containing protein n=1 Tax=Haliovirga abyssi TaxID=2996794 RepID=A0AAU9DIX5_9FUSO|nr:type II secretion system protein [Haliovirga abyssi]BDU49782.1 hypothetical protein HLVA_03510 [Haliovirga abyssi]